MIRTKKAPNKADDPKRVVRAEAQRALISALLSRGKATADDIRSVVKIPAGVHPACIGVAVGCLAREGLIVMDSVQTTARRVAHGRLLRVWRLTNRHAARQWMNARQSETGT